MRGPGGPLAGAPDTLSLALRGQPPHGDRVDPTGVVGGWCPVHVGAGRCVQNITA